MSGKVLVLYGSPKGERGASAYIASQVIEGIRGGGAEVSTLSVYRCLDQEEAFERLVKAFDEAEGVVLAFPLYIDTLPAGVTEALARLLLRREGMSRRRRRLLAICNCGFPESRHCRYALRSCQLFADRMGMEFWGGAAIGQGGMLGGATGQGRANPRQVGALRSMGSRLAEGKAIPAQAVELLARPAIPSRMYTLLGNMGWNRAARRNGVRGQMRDRPYQRG